MKCHGRAISVHVRGPRDLLSDEEGSTGAWSSVLNTVVIFWYISPSGDRGD
jgi:hypothetical protein